MQKFLSELRRRHVHKVAIGYAAISWFILEVSDFVFPRIGINNDEAIDFFLLVAAIGFPIALILGWIFDLTDDGIVRTASVPKSEVPNLKAGQLAQITLTFTLIGVIAFLMLDRQADVFPQADGYTIGVLPFKNISLEPETDYFSDGISEELLNALVGVRELKVASKSSSFYLKNSDSFKNWNHIENPEFPFSKDIGQRLAVQLLLTGSVRLDGDRVRISAQLNDTVRGLIIWSENYDGVMKDVLTLQNDIAKQIVSAVTPVIDPASNLASYTTKNPDAFRHYLRGKDYLRQGFIDESLDQAVNQFDAAISLDRRFVQAYAGNCRAKLARYTLQRAPSDFDEAERSCIRALSLQANQTQDWDVHLALGDLYREAGEFELSLNQLDTALNLRDDLPQIITSKAQTLADLKQDDEAIATFNRAIDLNPGYWDSYLALANYYYNRDEPNYQAAIDAYQEVLKFEPGYSRALIGLGSVYYMNRQPTKAEETWQLAEENARSESQGNLARLYSNRGLTYYYEEDFAQAVQMHKNATELAPNEHKYWGRLAESYRGLGNQDMEQEAYLTAIPLAQETELINPRDWETLGLLSLYFAHTNQPGEARSYQTAMLNVAPKNATAYYFASLASLAIADFDVAINHLAASVANDESGGLRSILENDPDLSVLKEHDPEAFTEALAN